MSCFCNDIINCKICKRKEQRRKAAKKYRENNREKVRESSRKYVENNKKKRRESSLKYYLKNKEKIIEHSRVYRDKNKESIRRKGREYYHNNKESVRKYNRRRWDNDPVYKLRKNISLSVRLGISGFIKKGSVVEFLTYTIEELKKHLESQFKPWMTWENWGRYNSKTWNDNDQFTWTWQIDHIIPHSKFNYTSMEDEEFRKCWALENLRPYSAKQNIIDGARK